MAKLAYLGSPLCNAANSDEARVLPLPRVARKHPRYEGECNRKYCSSYTWLLVAIPFEGPCVHSPNACATRSRACSKAKAPSSSSLSSLGFNCKELISISERLKESGLRSSLTNRDRPLILPCHTNSIRRVWAPSHRRNRWPLGMLRSR